MKHPALVRVFAVVLAIMCSVMSCAGFLGLSKTKADFNNNLAELEKMREDIDEYNALLAENEGKEPYKTYNEALEELKEQHEETSAEHRTELATYSATKGGIKTGVEALDNADAALAAGKAELEKQKKELENTLSQLKELQTALTTYNTCKPQLDAMLAAKGAMDNLAALSLINLPSEGGSVLSEEGDEIEPQDEEQTNSDTTSVLEFYYQNAIYAGELAQTVMMGMNDTASSGIIGNAVAVLKNTNPLSPAVYNEQVQIMQAVAVQASAALSAPIAQLQAVVEMLEPVVTNKDVPSAEELSQSITAIETGLVQLEAGAKQLTDAEAELYYQRTLIWYEMGKLEDKAVELEETKKLLLEEAEEIAEKEQLSEEQKQREKRLKSLYLTFADKPAVSDALENGDDFVHAVEEYINHFEEESYRDAEYRGYANILMLACFAFAFIVLLAGFEIIKKFALVRIGTIFVFLLASAAMGIFLWLGRGVSYSAMGVLIFAFIQFAVSGRVKKKSI